jgi:hypothetical protein
MGAKMKTKAMMIDDGDAYRVVVPAELASKWETLPEREHRLLSGRLRHAARSARSSPAVWPAGPAGRHRGRHRAVVDNLWILYRLDDERCTVSLLGFGHVVRGEEPA